MKTKKTAALLGLCLLFALGLLLALFPSPARGQTVMGQYEEEAPLGTWNLFGASGASSLGRGAALFAPCAADASAIFTNPALAARLQGLTLSVGGGIHSASMFRYGPVNTGPISSADNLSATVFALDLAAVTWNVKGWVVGLGAALTEIYDRPYVEAGSAAYNALFTFSQEGFLRVWNISLGRELLPGLSLGLGFNLVSGRRTWEMNDSWNPPARAVIITDERSRELSGRFLNGGLLWRLSERVSLAAAFRTAFRLYGPSRSLLRYRAPAAGTDILIEAEGEDEIRRPGVVGVGVSWALRNNLKILGEAGWWNWSSYTATSFGEEQPRAFRDTWRAGAAVEYKSSIRLFGRDFLIPSSLGLIYDRQPMENPRSSYIGYTLGTGIHRKGFRLDMGSVFGFENGSGRRLVARRLAVTLTVRTRPRGSGE
ncbi:MAG: hypothetical protein JW747_06500 [Candidatus Aminicenantes bacterium]|nr:hypothetical protein [Candidatus Aminicenantes bacterium]